mmetsp:Transcript_21119/g.38365  ORF Transcript_21119/g.38365 Transcript_21119/m.38365 type:complete len:87 (+) Transcript_21119:2706-2966(+)
MCSRQARRKRHDRMPTTEDPKPRKMWLATPAAVVVLSNALEAGTSRDCNAAKKSHPHYLCSCGMYLTLSSSYWFCISWPSHKYPMW